MSTCDIRVRDLSFSYPSVGSDRAVSIFSGLSFSLAAGEPGVIFASTDSGKTTLSRILIGLVPRFTGGALAGSAVCGGTDLLLAKPYELVERIGLVFQDSDEQIFTTLCETEVAFALESIGMPRPKMQARIDHALGFMGLGDFRLRNPATLSGGEKKRLLVACLAAIDPDLWILDEVFQELDNYWKSVLLKYLGEMGKTTLFLDSRWSPHYARCCASFSVLKGGSMVCTAADPGSPDLSAELAREGVILPTGGVGPGIPTRRGEPFVRVERLSFRFSDADPFHLQVEALELEKSAICALVGRNGSGKSTFGKILCGLITSQQGTIVLRDDHGFHASTSRELNRAVGYLFQNPDYQIFLPTVFEELALGPRSSGIGEAEVEERVQEAIRIFRLPHGDTPPALMSYGARKRLQAATYFLLGRDFLILDEIDSGLSFGEFLPVLAALASSGAGITLITHDFALARAVSGRIILMHEGRVLRDLSPERFGELEMLTEGRA